MEETQVFRCSTNSTVKNIFSKNAIDTLFLQIESDKVSGKGYICNQDGRNEYIDDFSFGLAEVKNVFLADFMEMPALAFDARLTSLYGAKNVRVFLPQLKSMESAVSAINRAKNGKNKASESVQVQSQASTRPVKSTAQPAPKDVQKSSVAAEKELSKKSDVNSISLDDDDLSAGEFQKKMDKLTILKECGLLGDKEFVAKKIELVGEYCDLTDFNEKIQKLIVLKECGLLSETEFEANRMDIIKECCSTDIADLKEYRKNVQKMSFLEMGGVITPEEFERSKKILVDDIEFKLSDTNEEFSRKLKRLPILKEGQLISQKEYKQKIDAMYAMISVDASDKLDSLSEKLGKWCVLRDERYISNSELKEKQTELISKCLDVTWKKMDELRNIVRKMKVFRECDWLTDKNYGSRKEAVIDRIENNDDSTIKLKFYEMLCDEEFITEDEYRKKKQQSIDEIFKPYSSMAEFKERVNSLMEFEKNGVITEKEFIDYKAKLMNDL
ncbi:MAG: hypothetical protein E7291_07345 [Lachnospiraceae bacterium]|nr:hypothetical protein [Lachnospiraceae bacterium]